MAISGNCLSRSLIGCPKNVPLVSRAMAPKAGISFHCFHSPSTPPKFPKRYFSHSTHSTPKQIPMLILGLSVLGGSAIALHAWTKKIEEIKSSNEVHQRKFEEEFGEGEVRRLKAQEYYEKQKVYYRSLPLDVLRTMIEEEKKNCSYFAHLNYSADELGLMEIVESERNKHS